MKIKQLDPTDKERIRQFAEDLGKSFTKDLLDYYLIYIKTIAKDANKK
jgi:hypothetical protein